MKIAESAIAWNCEFLRLPVPSVRVVEPSELATPTVKCAAAANGSRILINRTFAESGADTADGNEAFIWLVFSHECRHIWQARHSHLIDGHCPSSELSVRDYNRQAAEIDAWAWGAVVLSERFHARPTLEKNFGAELWQKIDARARQITKEGLY